MKATELLKKDHGAVKRLFTQFGRTTTRAQKTRTQLIEKIDAELAVHARIEEEIFYPAMSEIAEARPLVDEAKDEHEDVTSLVGEIRGMDPKSRELAARVRELRDAVVHHASEEEREMFRLAEQLGDERLAELGQRLEQRKHELTETEKPGRRGGRKVA